MKKIFILASALMLSACSNMTTGHDPGLGKPPAPLEQTQVDDRALILAWQTFDALLYSIDALREAKVLVPGTARSEAIANHIDAARNWMNVATEAQRLGQLDSYEAAAAQAQAAIAAIRKALEKSP